MGILNYTTRVDAAKTAGEVVHLLARKGAVEVHQRFAGGKPSGIAFAMMLDGRTVYFELPVNVAGVYKHMGSRTRVVVKMDQAERVAWRIVKDWVEVQIAIVESGQAEMAQAFMPYALEPNSDRTMFQVFTENNQKRLASSSEAKRLGCGN